MNKLYSNGISSEKLELLSNNIINYINELQQGNSMKVLDCNDDLEKNSDIKTKKLTLNEKIVYNHNFFPTEIY